MKGKLWATFVPAEAPPPRAEGAPRRTPRGVSIVARDFQSVVLYNADGSFAGVRRPGSGKPMQARAARRNPITCPLLLFEPRQALRKW